MKKILLIAMLATLFVGCSTKSPTLQPIPVVEKQQDVIIHRNPDKMLGTRLGCSQKRIDWGFSKEGCGDDWGKALYIDWGGVE